MEALSSYKIDYSAFRVVRKNALVTADLLNDRILPF